MAEVKQSGASEHTGNDAADTSSTSRSTTDATRARVDDDELGDDPRFTRTFGSTLNRKGVRKKGHRDSIVGHAEGEAPLASTKHHHVHGDDGGLANSLQALNTLKEPTKNVHDATVWVSLLERHWDELKVGGGVEEQEREGVKEGQASSPRFNFKGFNFKLKNPQPLQVRLERENLPRQGAK